MDTTEKAIGGIDAMMARAARELTGAEMIIKVLMEQKVKNVFGYPGGTVLPLYDALERSSIGHTLVSHEQGAVHAADGYARVTGEPGVVFVTSGPGATNTVTGIQTAFADSSPLVVITGQVPVALLGTDAFQECNITDITKSCTKRNYLVKDVAALAETLREAFSVARSGRPGPVLVDIPKDVQLAKGLFFEAGENISKKTVAGFEIDADDPKIVEAVKLMAAAERPVFYTGGGVLRSEGAGALRALAQMTGFPVTSTLMGLGAFPASHPRWLGMLGMHGTYEANMAMHGADLIVAIGARFDDRVTGALSGFAPNAKIVHIDINRRSIGKIVKADLGIVADCRSAMEAIIACWRKTAAQSRDMKGWYERIESFRQQRDSLAYERSGDEIKPQFVLETLNKLIEEKDVYIITDVGQNQMWAAQYLRMENPNRFVTSGGLGTMGFGLPAAIGVKSAHPEAMVICVCGDGGFHMTSGEMATAMSAELPVKVLILNNGVLGMVHQWNKLTYQNANTQHTKKAQPDFVKLALAYGWEASSCADPQKVEKELRALIESPNARLLNVMVAREESVMPMIPAGKPHNEMMFALPKT
ncbi:MAG: biosynthetic-type acetolactate synthase large subunit [Alphaproteobacteria bacterium]|nr:biosynthetic-type acetolactate synthase large subunit [Alphaproteobacteria bacterium]